MFTIITVTQRVPPTVVIVLEWNNVIEFRGDNKIPALYEINSQYLRIFALAPSCSVMEQEYLHPKTRLEPQPGQKISRIIEPRMNVLRKKQEITGDHECVPKAPALKTVSLKEPREKGA